MESRGIIFAAAFLVVAQLAPAQTGAGRPASRAERKKLATGPEVGEKVPYFRAPDQQGNLQDLASIRGPKGAMVVFFRSADW